MKAKDFAKELCEKTNWKKDEMCPPPLESQEGLNALIDHFLGEDWYVTLSISQRQVNAEAVYEILMKYPKPRKQGLLNRIFKT